MPKQHLVENFKVQGTSLKKLPLTEKNRIIEKDGKEYKCRAAYEFPIWRLDKENLNERIYSSELAEYVVKNSRITLGLTNHPKEEVDVGETFCVERNPHIREGVFYVDAYLVGDKGQLAKEILEAGGELGLSSSAYGDVKDKMVLTEGFEIERYADWVDTPSYEVFVTAENNINSPEKVKEDRLVIDEHINGIGIGSPHPSDELHVVSNNNKLFINEGTNTIGENKDTTMQEKENKPMSLEEKNLKIGVRNLFKEAESTESPKEQLEVYNQILEYCEGVDFADEYITEATGKINEINTTLHELAEKAKVQEKEVANLKEDNETSKKSLKEVTEDLEKTKAELEVMAEKFDLACNLLDSFKEREAKIREMYQVSLAEKNGMVSASEYHELQVYAESLEEEKEKLKESLVKYRKKLFKQNESSDDNKKSHKVQEKEEDKEKDTINESVEEKKLEDNEYHFTRNNVDVQNYYLDLLESNPSVSKIKEEILSKATLMEAQKTYLNLKDLVEDIPTPFARRISEQSKDLPKKEVKTKSSLQIRKGWD